MQQTFDYLAHVPCAVRVCDTAGIVLYQNALAIARDGNVVGQCLYGCHNPQSQQKIRDMLSHDTTNTYEVIKGGQRRLVYQTPWYEQEGGPVAGLVEFAIDLPQDMPVRNRDIPQD
ncbi:MAG: PAS sensor protein [Bacteroidales bacterium]|nr:PAS sensor protein [Candidatus Equimonas enterica]